VDLWLENDTLAMITYGDISTWDVSNVLHMSDMFNGMLLITRVKLEVPRTGFEPVTHSLEGCCSIQLSYRGINYFIIKITINELMKK
tara:strand:+ start:208 stop:468 length:261 start_codon:yes stop_codon:yes gene_type:complete